MNFNGKFWHKPGHLGMTTAQVKEALESGGNNFIDIKEIAPTMFSDIETALAAALSSPSGNAITIKEITSTAGSDTAKAERSGLYNAINDGLLNILISESTLSGSVPYKITTPISYSKSTAASLNYMGIMYDFAACASALIKVAAKVEIFITESGNFFNGNVYVYRQSADT